MCDESSPPDASLWVAGVFLGIGASIAGNLGVNVQKFSFMRESKRCKSSMRPYLHQPLWVMGLGFVIFGSFGDFVALGFAPTTLIIPIGGFTLVANLFFAHLWLKERLGSQDILSTCLIICGVILVAVFAEKGSSCHTFDQLVAYYAQPSFIIYCAAVFLSLLGLHILTTHIERIYAEKGPNSKEYMGYRTVHPVTYPAMSGICGGQSVLMAKSVAELVKSTMADGKNEFLRGETYLIIILMFVFIFAQIHLLTKGLRWFDAIFIVPVFQCFFITSSIIGGIVYFKEIENLSTEQLAGFTSGVVVLLSGVYGLSQRRMNALKPIQRFRMAVHMVRFLMRMHKSQHSEWNFNVAYAEAKTDPAACANAAILGIGTYEAQAQECDDDQCRISIQNGDSDGDKESLKEESSKYSHPHDKAVALALPFVETVIGVPGAMTTALKGVFARSIVLLEPLTSVKTPVKSAKKKTKKAKVLPSPIGDDDSQVSIRDVCRLSDDGKYSKHSDKHSDDESTVCSSPASSRSFVDSDDEHNHYARQEKEKNEDQDAGEGEDEEHAYPETQGEPPMPPV